MRKENNKLTFIDLFAGCGGLSEGFLQSDRYEALAHVEWEKPMIKTLRNRLITKWNHTEEEALKRGIHFDIQKTDELINGNWTKETSERYAKTNHKDIIKDGIRGLIGKQKVNIIIGGPPCQAYSVAGRAQDNDLMRNDFRNYLFESFVKVVDEFKPEVFVFENVPGLLSACPGGKKVTERIYEAFKNIGYEIRKPELLSKSVFTASELGVPQKRDRVIIIGVRVASKISLESLYVELHSLKQIVKPKNVFDAIGHLPKYEPLKTPEKINGKKASHKLIGGEKIKFHDARYNNQRDIAIFKQWLRDNMNNSTSQKKIAFYNDILGKRSNHSKYRNLEWDKPSPTIVAHLYKDGLMFIHPDINQARTITVKEAALLQSFPDDFDFIGSRGFALKMIGNAVPPEMARNIAMAISTKIHVK